ncbi:glycosyltransferase family 2 protein, partial [Nioella sp.]|uniref:glycosyltransferase family 2 protein n=1 Tax=Nioella sp. TaxID=1912091 RepID=UPI0035174520
MIHASLQAFSSHCARQPLGKGPFAIVIAEDATELASTLDHLTHLGFRRIFLLAPDDVDLPDHLADPDLIDVIRHPTRRPGTAQAAVNMLIRLAPGQWLHYCYNAEYLFYPFCETRNVNELLVFHTEERRSAMLTYVVDLYAGDLKRYPNAVSLDHAWIDKSGYYALGRPDPDNHNYPKERQLDFFGGLRWRYEEHVPKDRRKIDRVGLFKAKRDLVLRADYTFNDEEYNTYA